MMRQLRCNYGDSLLNALNYSHLLFLVPIFSSEIADLPLPLIFRLNLAVPQAFPFLPTAMSYGMDKRKEQYELCCQYLVISAFSKLSP